MEFSKKLLIVGWTVALSMTALAIILPIVTLADLQGLYIVLPLSWGEVATATGFYFWKAKSENRSKYMLRFINKLADQYGIDAALQAAEITIKD